MFGYNVGLEYTTSQVLEAFVAFPYVLWNLDFLTPGFCLHEDFGTLEVLVLKYVSAFLPLAFVIVCYILIKLYDRNCRVVRCMWRPFQSCLRKIHKIHEMKAPIIRAFATFLLLSYTKLMFVSFSFLAPTTLYNAQTGESLGYAAFYFDASKPMFKGKYAILPVIAVLISATFIALPLLYLTLYSAQCFQKIIDKLPFTVALRIFAEVFNGDFRDGTDNGDGRSKDCRYFAGYYLLLRVIVFTIFNVRSLSQLDQYFIQQLLFVACIFLFAIVKPYKKVVYNNLDVAMFTLLSLLNAFSSYNSQIYDSHHHINYAVFWINYMIMFLPLVYFICYIVYVMLLCKCYTCFVCCTNPNLTGERGSQENIPDRLANPHDYNSRNLYKALDQKAADHVDEDSQIGVSKTFQQDRNTYGSFEYPSAKEQSH